MNKSKDKNHILISTDAEKACDNIQHPFMKRALKKLGIEGKFLNNISAKYDKCITNITLTETISTKIRNKTILSTFSILIQYSFGSPNLSNKTGARNKRDTNREGRNQIIPICR
jgi:hypothetical protein